LTGDDALLGRGGIGGRVSRRDGDEEEAAVPIPGMPGKRSASKRSNEASSSASVSSKFSPSRGDMSVRGDVSERLMDEEDDDGDMKPLPPISEREP